MGKALKKENIHLDFLAQLSDPDKNELYRIGHKRTFSKNDYIFKAGDHDSNVWILTQGRVKIFKSSAQGRDILLWFALAGDIFGMAECMQERSRMVYALASEDTEAISISHTKFKEWICVRPEISYILMKIMTERMREISLRFLSLANGNIQLEIAQLLLRLASTYGTLVGTDLHIGIPLTEQDIADMVGTSRQGVSSCLANMKRHGIIDCVRHFMAIKNLDQLKQIANEVSGAKSNTKWLNKTSIGEQTGSRSILI
jgi:CRP-like cAMP-binding protein